MKISKAILFVALTSTFSLSAFAQESSAGFRMADSRFVENSYKVLSKLKRRIILEGDTQKGERMSSVIYNVDKYLLFKLAVADEMSITETIKNKSSVEDLKMSCEIFPRGIAARCDMTIQSRLGDVRNYRFYVGLDQKQNPVSVLENRVTVTSIE